ncbi:MAG: FG-GAP repeat domain-containing protein [Nannocystales bacterium]
MTHLRIPTRPTSLLATLALLATPACFNPDDATVDTDPMGSSDGSGSEESTATMGTTDPATTTSPTTNPTDPTSGADTGSTTTDDPTSTTNDPTDPATGSETGDPPAACDDGNADPGELCPPNAPETVITGMGVNPTDLVLARLQGADRVDVITISPADNAIFVAPSDGAGGFGPPISADVGNGGGGGGGGPGFLAATDLEPDGDIDIVAGASRQAVWLLNNGVGAFQGGGFVDLGFGGPEGMGVGNMDLDPAIDIVATEGYNTNVFLGRMSGGNYIAGPSGGGSDGSVQATGGDSHVAVTEFGFDGDGFADVVVASRFGGGGVVPVRGNGDATFTGGLGTDIPMCGEAGCEPTDLAAADLDGDGEVEILMTHSAGVSIAPGVGDGTWGPVMVVPASGSVDVDVVDLNNDDILDVMIVSADEDDPALFLALGNGDGTLAELVTMPLMGRPTAADVSDFNGDGAPDIAVAHSATEDHQGGVAIFLMVP